MSDDRQLSVILPKIPGNARLAFEFNDFLSTDPSGVTVHLSLGDDHLRNSLMKIDSNRRKLTAVNDEGDGLQLAFLLEEAAQECGLSTEEFTNCLNNAVQYTRKDGQVEVKISKRYLDPIIDAVFITVAVPETADLRADLQPFRGGQLTIDPSIGGHIRMPLGWSVTFSTDYSAENTMSDSNESKCVVDLLNPAGRNVIGTLQKPSRGMTIHGNEYTNSYRLEMSSPDGSVIPANRSFPNDLGELSDPSGEAMTIHAINSRIPQSQVYNNRAGASRGAEQS